jgi:hypothetical protein
VYAVIMRSASGRDLVVASEFDIVHVGISSDQALSNLPHSLPDAKHFAETAL